MQKMFYTLFFILFFFFSGYAQLVKDSTFRLKFKGYVMQKYKDEKKKVFVTEINKDDQVLWSKAVSKSSYMEFISLNEQLTWDIDLDRENEFVLQEYSGPASREYTWHIFTLGKNNFKVKDQVRSMYLSPWFVEVVKDSIYEIYHRDYTFAHWNASFEQSPFMEIILHIENGKYNFAADKMRRDSLTLDEKNIRLVREAMKSFYETAAKTYPYKVDVLEAPPQVRWGFIPSSLWGQMMNYYFRGQAQLADQFLEKAWYEKVPGKEEFYKDFKAQMAKSPYWEAVKKMNEGQ